MQILKKEAPAPQTDSPSMYSLKYEELEQWLKENGEPAFRAKQLFCLLYTSDAADE